MPPYAEVVVDLPTRRIDHTFWYAVPDAVPVHVGSRVQVPLGPRQVFGFVVALSGASPVPEPRAVQGVVGEGPFFGEETLSLARWVSDRYLCPLIDALRAAIPPEAVEVHVRVARPARTVDAVEALQALYERSPTLAPLFEAVVDRGEASVDDLRRDGFPDAPRQVQALRRRGLVEIAQRTRPPRASPRARRVARLGTSPEEAMEAVQRMARRTPAQALALQLLIEHGEIAPADLARRARTDAATIARLVRRGWAEIIEREVHRGPDVGGPIGRGPVPTFEQEAALAAVRASLGARRPATYLLYGAAGSGKTEVYLQLIADVLAQGRGAIVLVPEISLTPQAADRFRARLGDTVAVLHSGLGAGERFDAWRRIRSGEARVVVGPRSAVFAPVRDLGVVVVDEEQDPSYKQEQSPRYHARDVALERAARAGAVAVLGSATPSVESHHAARTGRYQMLRLTRGIEERRMPSVEIVDMREEIAAGNRSPFSRALGRAMRRHLAAGDQVLLFLNRRGFANLLLCRECGHVVRCSRCDVAMTYHLPDRVLRCHVCNRTLHAPDVCPHCGGIDLRLFGVGTQRVEEEARRAFPRALVARMDSDAMARRGALARLFRAVASGQVNVLVGTQMIAKGFDLPGIGLVGVISAETALHLPDFRAGERTYQVLAQVAGRAGRAARPGEVIVQTYDPSHPAIQAAATHDDEAFYTAELRAREEFSYPPFVRLVRIVVSSTRADAAEEACAALAAHLAAAATPAEVLGPSPAPFARVRGWTRWQLVLKFPRDADIGALRQALAGYAAPKGVRVVVDVDPVEML